MIGKAALVSKVLCTEHNCQLGTVDAAAGGCFEALREVRRVDDVRNKMSARRWNVLRRSANGSLLERWFLKTCISFMVTFGDGLTWRHTSSAHDLPPGSLVDVAYGVEPLSESMGLYFFAPETDEVRSGDSVDFAPLLDNDEVISGGLFCFRGFKFVLNLVEERLPDPFGLKWSSEWAYGQTVYRPKRIRFRNRGFLSQVLEFQW